MTRILVSIMSDHAVPNYLYMREEQGTYDEMVFISTQQTLKVGAEKNIESALGMVPESIRRIEVSNDNFTDIIASLETAQFDPTCEYIVNLTGGTKMMALAVRDYFKSLEHVSFVYVPIGKNEYLTLDDGKTHTINYRLSLKEFFALYGMSYECSSVDPQNQEEKERIVNDAFKKIRKHEYSIDADPRMQNAQNLVTPELKRFWGGEWFEVFVYNRIRRGHNLPDEAIAQGIKIYPILSPVNNTNSNDNEVDVAYMLDNRLHVIECKALSNSKNARNLVHNYLYKLAAIAKDFGLRPVTHLALLCPLNTFSDKVIEGIHHRCKVLGIKGILTGPDLAADKLNI